MRDLCPAGVRTYNPKAIPKLHEGQNVRIAKGKASEDRTDKQKKRRAVIFEGKVVSLNSKHFTVENKNNIRESFNYADFITGDIRLTTSIGG